MLRRYGEELQVAQRGMPDGMRRKYDLSTEATSKELGESGLRELCFDAENHDYLMNLLMRDEAPAWVVEEHLSMDDEDGEFVEHRCTIVINAELTDEQWIRLAQDDYREVVESVVEAADYRDLPDEALAEAQRCLEEEFGTLPPTATTGHAAQGIPQWMLPFLAPVFANWPERGGEIQMAVVTNEGAPLLRAEVPPSQDGSITMLLEAARQLGGRTTRAQPGAILWWWPIGGDVNLVGGGVILTTGNQACEFSGRRRAGGTSWQTDDHNSQWPEERIAPYLAILNAFGG